MNRCKHAIQPSNSSNTYYGIGKSKNSMLSTLGFTSFTRSYQSYNNEKIWLFLTSRLLQEHSIYLTFSSNNASSSKVYSLFILNN